MTNLVISGSSFYIDCYCTRWKSDDYSYSIDTIMNKAQLQTLRNNITPGAIGESYKLLGRTYYYDKTFTGDNTIVIKPGDMGNISNMKNDRVVFIKNITDEPLEGDSGDIYVKLNCVISGNQSI